MWPSMPLSLRKTDFFASDYRNGFYLNAKHINFAFTSSQGIITYIGTNNIFRPFGFSTIVHRQQYPRIEPSCISCRTESTFDFSHGMFDLT